MSFWGGVDYHSGEINYIFCNDEDLLQINRDFLQHDYYTDIITFDMSEKECNFLQSEIYISVDRVKDNALKITIFFVKNYIVLFFHEILHLCGYKDKTKEECVQLKINAWIDISILF